MTVPPATGAKSHAMGAEPLPIVALAGVAASPRPPGTKTRPVIATARSAGTLHFARIVTKLRGLLILRPPSMQTRSATYGPCRHSECVEPHCAGGKFEVRRLPAARTSGRRGDHAG